MPEEATMESPDTMDSPDMMEGGADEAPMEEGGLTEDYIQDTISSATNRIADSKYLEEEEAAEQKKTPAAKGAKAQAGGQQQEVSTEDEDDSKEARTNAKWTAYRNAYREGPKLKAEVADLRRQLQAAGDTREVEQLRQAVQHFQQEREQLMRAVEVGNVEQSQRWNDYVTEPLNQMWEHAQNICKRNNLDPKQFVDLLVSRNDRALNDYMGDAGPGDKHHAFGMMHTLDQIEHTKGRLRQNAHQLSQSDQAQYSAYRDAHVKQLGEVRQGAVSRIMPKIEERVLGLLPKDKRADLASATKHILDHDNWSEDVKMYSGFAAVVLPDLMDAHKALRAELKAAKDQLIKLRGGTPNINRGATTSPRRAQIENQEEEDAELQKPIREFAMGAARRIQAASGMRGLR